MACECVFSVAAPLIHAEGLQLRRILVDGEHEGREEHTALGLLRVGLWRDGEYDIVALLRHVEVAEFGEVALATLEDVLEDSLEGGELRILLTTRLVTLALDDHREVTAFHEQLVLAAINDDTHFSWLLHR